MDHWENNASALLQGFPERGVLEYLAQRILRESGVRTPRRLCYLRFEAQHRDVVQRRIPAETIKALEDYIDMQDAYLSRVFANHDPDTAALRSVSE